MSFFNTAIDTYTHTLASPTKRLVAYAADCAILYGGLLAWQAALYPINPVVAATRDQRQPRPARLHAWVFLTGTVPFLTYFAVMQSSARQATFGQRWMKIKVTSTDGKRISLLHAFLRSAVMLLPFELNHLVLLYLMPEEGEPRQAFSLGYAGVWTIIAGYIAVMLVTERRQSVHDLAVGTVVAQD